MKKKYPTQHIVNGEKTLCGRFATAIDPLSVNTTSQRSAYDMLHCILNSCAPVCKVCEKAARSAR